MAFEFQIEIEAMENLLQFTVANNIPVIPDVITLPGGVPSHVVGFEPIEGQWIGHQVETDGPVQYLNSFQGQTPNITIGPTGLNATKRRPEFVASLNLLHSSVAAMTTSNFDEAPIEKTFFTVTFAIDAVVDANGVPVVQPVLKSTLADPFLTPAQKQKLQDSFSQVHIPLDLAGALGGTGQIQVPRMLNAGATMSATGEFIIFRFEFDQPVEQQWRDFYQGVSPSGLGDGQWAVSVPPLLVIGPLQQMLTQSLAQGTAFTVTQQPFVGWEPMLLVPGGVPMLHATFSGTAINACPGVNIDVSVDLFVTMTLTATNTLRLDLTIDYTKDKWETTACVLEAVAAWGAFGLAMTLSGDLDISGPGSGAGYYWAGLAIGPFFMFVGMIAFVSSDMPLQMAHLSDNLPPQLQKIDETHYFETIDLGSVASAFPGIAVTRVGATADALVFGGTLTSPTPILGRLQTSLQNGFEGWDHTDPCHPATDKLVSEADVLYHTQVPGPPSALVKPKLYLQNLYDPLGEYTDTKLAVGGIQVTVDDYVFAPSGPNAPYPCQLLFLSTQGGRILTIPPPPPPPAPPPPGSVASAGLAIWRLDNCDPLRNISFGHIWPKWLVDPPIDNVAYLREWGFAISGLQAGDRVVASKGEQVIVQGVADRSGAVSLHMFDSGSSQPLRVELAGGVSRAGAKLHMQQVLWAPTAEVPVATPVTALRLEGGVQELRLELESGRSSVALSLDPRTGALRRAKGAAVRGLPARTVSTFGKYLAHYDAQTRSVRVYLRLGSFGGAASRSPVSGGA